MKKLKTWINIKIREWFWPNYQFVGEQRIEGGKIVYHLKDIDYPELFHKVLLLPQRKDLTEKSWFTKIYNYDKNQVAGDWVITNIKLYSGKIVTLKISAIADSPEEAFLTDEEKMELIQIVNDRKFTQ